MTWYGFLKVRHSEVGRNIYVQFWFHSQQTHFEYEEENRSVTEEDCFRDIKNKQQTMIEIHIT